MGKERICDIWTDSFTDSDIVKFLDGRFEAISIAYNYDTLVSVKNWPRENRIVHPATFKLRRLGTRADALCSVRLLTDHLAGLFHVEEVLRSYVSLEALKQDNWDQALERKPKDRGDAPFRFFHRGLFRRVSLKFHFGKSASC